MLDIRRKAALYQLAIHRFACTLSPIMCSFRSIIIALAGLVLIFNQLSGAHLHAAHEANTHELHEHSTQHHHDSAAMHLVADLDEHHWLGHNLHGQTDIEPVQAGASSTPQLPLLALVAVFLLVLLLRQRAIVVGPIPPTLIPWQPRRLIPPAQAPPIAF